MSARGDGRRRRFIYQTTLQELYIQTSAPRRNNVLYTVPLPCYHNLSAVIKWALLLCSVLSFFLLGGAFSASPHQKFFFSSGHYFIIIIIMDGWIESRIASMILLAIYTLIFFQIHPPHTWQNRIYWNGNAGGGLGGGGGRVQYCTVWCLAKRMPMGGGCGRIHHHLRSPPYKDDGTSLPGVRISAFTTGMRDTDSRKLTIAGCKKYEY